MLQTNASPHCQTTDIINNMHSMVCSQASFWNLLDILSLPISPLLAQVYLQVWIFIFLQIRIYKLCILIIFCCQENGDGLESCQTVSSMIVLPAPSSSWDQPNFQEVLTNVPLGAIRPPPPVWSSRACIHVLCYWEVEHINTTCLPVPISLSPLFCLSLTNRSTQRSSYCHISEIGKSLRQLHVQWSFTSKEYVFLRIPVLHGNDSLVIREIIFLWVLVLNQHKKWQYFSSCSVIRIRKWGPPWL